MKSNSNNPNFVLWETELHLNRKSLRQRAAANASEEAKALFSGGALGAAALGVVFSMAEYVTHNESYHELGVGSFAVATVFGGIALQRFGRHRMIMQGNRAMLSGAELAISDTGDALVDTPRRLEEADFVEFERVHLRELLEAKDGQESAPESL